MKAILILLISLCACAKSPEELISADQFDKAQVVLRVKKGASTNGSCDKYCFPEVFITKVLKNQTEQKFEENFHLKVAVLNTSEAIPRGEVTLYLEPLNNKPIGEFKWRILGGTTKTGMSHARDFAALKCKAGTREFRGFSGIPGCCPDGVMCD